MMGRFKYIFFLVGILTLVSCGTSKEFVNVEKVDKIKDETIFSKLDSLSKVKFNTFYTKISTHYKDSSRSQGFKTSLRMYHDSVINTVVSVAIPIFQCVISKDSLKMTNKLQKCYVSERLDYFKDLLGVEFTYKNAQELFFGQPIDFDITKKHYRVNDPFSYKICSHRKKDIKKNEKAERKEIVKYYILSNDMKTLKGMEIFSPEDNVSIHIYFDERITIDGFDVPKIVRLKISTESQDIEVKMDYKKHRLNSEETIHFVIPDSYDKCK